ncbi:S-layer homology domain-containing protein [Paenibacillus arenilitoris]|uniref:S-layer homology domain-containing protein n=1 Tax=Paenibacillus arenilitoris TaxID=2772299 RepID=A0A927CJQ9_9BACL|nr:S-layer homology domain-containing protein [Paenibacillus arenilitoris]MBD2868392.1 S-layer homology domain-containing protein [Paenibacillus arenilitoris]
MKRVVSLILSLALLITLLPPFGASQQASAAGSYFLFPNEQDRPGNARIVSDQSVTLEGTINGVVGNSISYNVKQITWDGTTEREVNKTEEITTGISTTAGDNKLKISNLTLFPGLNKITFKGIAGTSTVSEAIYIEYRNSPMLYDLKVTFENKDFTMAEDEPTMLYSTAPVIKQTGDIVISGKAPNAQKITVVINGRSYEFNVSTSSSDSRFSTSLLSIQKGINTVILKVHNNGQIVETTREIAFYNGEVTFYDLHVKDTTSTAAYEPNLNFSTVAADVDDIKVTGKVILPLPLKDLNGTPANTIAPTAANLQNMLRLEHKEAGDTVASSTYPDANSITVSPTVIDSSTKFITVSYTFSLPTLAFDVENQFRIFAPNNSIYQSSEWNTFVLRDKGKAFIFDINYLSGYVPSMSSPTVNVGRLQGLQGTDIPSDGVNVYSMPMGLEVLIGNYAGMGTYSDILNVEGGTGSSFKQINHTEIVYRTVNNQSVPFLRLFVEINKLPTSGTNTIKVNLKSSTNGSTEVKTIVAKLLYGPYVKFNTLVEGMKVEYDSVKDTNPLTLLNKLGLFSGQLFNIANEAEVIYADDPGNNKKQSVFLYINNVEIPLETNGSATSFRPKNLSTPATIFNVLNKAGENTVKFVFRTAKNNYENTLKFTVVPTNLPVIPAPNTDGVYPYSATLTKPLPNDANFPMQGSIYTTKEARLNVYGTFDFVDLGGEASFATGISNITDKKNYKVTISSPNWNSEVKWDLSKEFTPTKNGVPIVGYETTPYRTPTSDPAHEHNASTPDAKIDFFYDVEGQYFYFKIINQEMPADGSSQVYVITVFNSGEAGPRATYRMEIDATSIPYTRYAPLDEKLTTNQNFVEVIIAAPGAETLVIGKEMAKKVKYIDYSQSTPQYIDAFSLTVKDLKPNKANEIEFTITRGQDEIEDTFEVQYQPATIPGAQFMETMKKTHKAFDGSLELSFESNTKLVRPSYNDSTSHAGQVYSGNDILFSIASPNDGIVDRHEFESQPANYSANSTAEGNLHIGYRFQDQARQYIKASPLFWIDGGQADDPESASFDPVNTGQDPFPFPNIEGKSTDSFAKRWNQFGLELVPTEPGELTVAYDASVAQAAGTTITVFRFDPYNSTWENIGGVVNEKDRTVTVPFTKFGYYVAAKLTRGYNDINDHPYAREAMEAIYAKGVMNAVDPIGVFGADRYVTRGEFTRMIIRALDIPLNYGGGMHFTYYPETITNANNANSIYDYRYIETAARAGFVRGTRPGFFDEDVDLSRQDASVVLARALNLKLETDAKKAKTALDKAFKDSGSFDYYSIPAVIAIQKKGFIQGALIDPSNPKSGSVFEPKAKLLRSDAAIIMARVMADLKKLPKIYGQK